MSIATAIPGCAAGGSARLWTKLGCVALWIGLLALGFGALSLGPVRAQGAHGVPLDVVAVIDGESISQKEFEAYLQRYLRQNLYHGGSQERLSELRSQALDQMILERLVSREIERRGIGGDQQAVEQQIAALKQRYGASGRWAEVEAKLPALRQHLYEKSRSEVLRTKIEEIAEPDEAALTRYYEGNLDLFTQPEAWSLSVILVGVPPTAATQDWRVADTKSQELYAEIMSGADFGAVAKANSTHESAASNGSLGLVHKGQLAPEIESALESIAVGGATPPVRVLEGYALFEKQGVRPARVQPFALVRERVRGLYLRDRGKQQWDQFTENLKANAQITVHVRRDAAEQEGANPPK